MKIDKSMVAGIVGDPKVRLLPHVCSLGFGTAKLRSRPHVCPLGFKVSLLGAHAVGFC